MTEKYKMDQIRDYWTEQAKAYGQSPAASWSDQFVIDMEINKIQEYLEDGDSVADIGCANGYSTLQFAQRKKINIHGIDYIPHMIDQANAHLKEIGGKLRGSARFSVGDIMSLNEPSDKYDKAIVIRVIINLENWENQVKGIRESARVLKPGGTLMLSEATLQGWEKINTLRGEWDLDPIPMPSFNQYLDENRVVETVAPYLKFIEIVNFSSTYFVGTRLLKPLLIKALGADIDVANPDMEWNRCFSQAPAFGDYGTQKLFVFQKI